MIPGAVVQAAAAVAARVAARTPGPRFHPATLSTYAAPPELGSVVLDGDSATVPALVVAPGFAPAAGARVLVAVHPPSQLLVVGALYAAAAPRGLIAPPAALAASAASRTNPHADIIGLSVKGTAEAGRSYRLTAVMTFNKDATGATVRWRFMRGATIVGGGLGFVVASGFQSYTSEAWDHNPPPGEYTWRMTAQADAGAVTPFASPPEFPSTLSVEDVGPWLG